MAERESLGATKEQMAYETLLALYGIHLRSGEMAVVHRIVTRGKDGRLSVDYPTEDE